MFSRVCLLALLTIAPCVSKTAYHRDWVAHPAVVERAAPETIFALGDVHGDYDRMITLLAAAKMVGGGPTPHWVAGKAVLVVTGDMIDKGPKPAEVVRFLIDLQNEAKQSGGEAIVLAGNHEVKYMADKGCQDDLGQLLCRLPFAAKVGDWFFSHGGNSAGRTVAQISADIVQGVDKDGFGTKALTAPDSLLEARLGEGKEQWIGLQNEANLLQTFGKALGVKHIVQGHQHNEIRFSDGAVRKVGQLYNYRGLLFLIDCGMSREIDDSHGAILRITRSEQFEAIYPDGSAKPL
jgi:hypothetical protein